MSAVSLERLSRLAGRAPRTPRWSPADADVAAYVAAVLTSLPRPWRYTCLKRGVVVFHLLRRAGRPVSLHVGVRRGGGGALEAHAWLVMAGAAYLESDPAEHEAFAVIATFPAGAGA